MAKDKVVSVKDAVFKLQTLLLEGIQNEDQLFAAGSLMSRSDYEDIVTERSITNVCGYPLCCNALPSERPRKGRYRISLKEHKVYDLQETYLFCSSNCVVSSKAFAGSLQVERCSALNPEKINNILKLFENLNLEQTENVGKDGDVGLSDLKIQEKTVTSSGEVSLEEWVGPSNAIEGYVPKPRERESKGSRKSVKKGSKAGHGKSFNNKDLINNEMNFVSTIIMQDEYSVSKASPGQTDTIAVNRQPEKVGLQIVRKDEDSIQDLSSSFKSGLNLGTSEKEKEVSKSYEAVVQSSPNLASKKKDSHSVSISERQYDQEKHNSSRKSVQGKGETSRVTVNGGASTSNFDPDNVKEKFQVEKVGGSCETKLKSSLKSAGQKKPNRTVTWADEKINGAGNKDLCEVKEFGDIRKEYESLGNVDVADDEDMLRQASAEACAIALSQASEAVASGDSDVIDAVSEAGITILPRPHDAVEEGTIEDDDILQNDSVTLKWPRKPGVSDIDFFESDDSWFDAPPEGFSLTLSPFATMWNAVFSWMTSSSLAYIYGRDESFHEEYLSVNGREYPCKVVLSDGRSSEIKQTLAGCLARAFPALVAGLGLPIPISTLEQGMACLLETMSFVDALPPFRTKQWQVVTLLFVDALSVCRIPALISYMTDRRSLFHKVLSGSQIGIEEYEILKDLVVPLGRAPHISAQSGA
ncbi:putative RNA polymerase II subunit B1 CTD phosphatase RPAP2 homolog [Vigna radiata var. radiata]|uniref:RNA polymerase II subunit B1 CTD phosphatase RPAP2 homolog n=1 Tax=Vigna radiata var. radiata TaxID=3916 RepID=A0A1S3V6P3_VIGRR|nr:putative RNA polymerase II subunit B1 CTD phosphatase RPAP2 homolog [Vigna radiata var. radiata]XP_014513956.1 putative RNA polymerase II subunit B1 CTD phosphatase RPAP2 homolog [Vigna radiata var. radiata]XP_022641323.1 putative RNA polymerase II subunit B1 CTD phosphatase RPAP2 homolog [Vigna radiata var. radiata]